MRTLAHLSDLHFGRHDPRKVEALLASLREHAPDLVVISGDFTQRAREREFEAAAEFLARIPQPKIMVPGNHDMPLWNVVERLLRPDAKFNRFIAPLGAPDDYYEDHEIAVLGINTSRRLTGKNGRVSEEQMAHIRRTLSDAPTSAVKILVTHHPIAQTGTARRFTLAFRADEALAAANAAHVHVLLSGHHHHGGGGASVAENGPGSGVLAIYAGTAVSERVRADGNSYNLIGVEGHGVRLQTMRWSPAGFARDTLETYRFHPGHWERVAGAITQT